MLENDIDDILFAIKTKNNAMRLLHSLFPSFDNEYIDDVFYRFWKECDSTLDHMKGKDISYFVNYYIGKVIIARLEATRYLRNIKIRGEKYG